MGREYYAHIDKTGAVPRCETVREHLQKVSNYAATKAHSYNLSTLLALTGWLHDLGKYSVAFQEHLLNEDDAKVDHAFAGAKLILDLAEKIAAMGTYSDEQVYWLKQTAVIVAHVILSHHGLHDWVDDSGFDYMQKRLADKDAVYKEICRIALSELNFDDLRTLLVNASAEASVYFNDMLKLASQQSDEKKAMTELAFYTGMFERWIQSFLIDADWTCTAAFQRNGLPPIPKAPDVCWRMCNARIKEQYAMWANAAGELNKKRNELAMYCLQAAMTQTEPAIRTLTMPTGSGKTMAAMRYALRYATHAGSQHIYYVAPYQSILEQNSSVIRGIVQEPNSFLEHHTDVRGRLAGNLKELYSYLYHAEHWDTPVIATTWVQLLNTLFADDLMCVRRFHQLAGSTLILDEIQSLPVNCTYLFNLAANFLNKICKANIVLCSATQPVLQTLDFPIKKGAEIIPENVETGIFETARLQSCVRKQGYTYAEAALFCVEQLKTYRNALCIVNTKRAAAEIYKGIAAAVGNDVHVYHLSTNMCAQHRLDVMTRLKTALWNREPCICVSTQLIEAGVDISFQCVVRSMAGIDNAIQAVGRCNRNGEYDNAASYVINIKDENVAYLLEIAVAQQVTRDVMSLDSFDADNILKPNTIEFYYKRLYKVHKEKLGYSLRDKGTKADILELLSTNDTQRALRRLNGVCTMQAFKTAGTAFKVITGEKYPVLVPYDEVASCLIQRIATCSDNVLLQQLITQAQRYIVEVYQNDLEKLKKQGLLQECTAASLWVLNPGIYNFAAGLYCSE